jgi:hypothetical protein
MAVSECLYLVIIRIPDICPVQHNIQYPYHALRLMQKKGESITR